MSKEAAQNKLDDLTVRGDIAHHLNTTSTAQKGLGINYLRHIEGLVNCCKMAMRKDLFTQTGVAP